MWRPAGKPPTIPNRALCLKRATVTFKGASVTGDTERLWRASRSQRGGRARRARTGPRLAGGRPPKPGGAAAGREPALRHRHRLTHGAACPGHGEPTLGRDICEPPQGDLENSMCARRSIQAQGHGCAVHWCCPCNFSARAESLPNRVKNQKTENGELQLAGWAAGGA